MDELHMKKLLRTVVSAENDLLDRKVYDQIIQDAQGRPRNALQILDKVLDADPDDRLKTAKRVAAQESKTIELCRALMDGSPWSKVRSILDGLRNEDPETIRRSILGYCNAVLLGGEDDQAGIVMEQFIDPFYDSGFPGLVFACYQVIREPQ